MENFETQTNIELNPVDIAKQEIFQESKDLRDQLDSEYLLAKDIEWDGNWNNGEVTSILDTYLVA